MEQALEGACKKLPLGSAVEQLALAGAVEELALAGAVEELALAGAVEELALAGAVEELALSGAGEELALAGAVEKLALALDLSQWRRRSSADSGFGEPRITALTSREQQARMSHGRRFWTEDDGGTEKGMGMIGARQAVRTVGAVCGGPRHGMSR